MTSLGAIHEIEAINAAGLLPGVRLGYVLCDTCSHASKALQSVEHMLSIRHSPTAICGYIDFRPRVKIFLGALHSEVAVTLSRLLSVYMIPLVSDKYLYLEVFNIFILFLKIQVEFLIALPEEYLLLSCRTTIINIAFIN